ncbi:hypothetical protein PAE9249_02457 [Paenibacillus sp. CECT 9249]|uniref:hypothetical protein n=1 Tax=Paenibacillus sp. CECT 9249 TaxID=2845385 RepID=UPI001E42581C|nr:hypothetical protein [Paenibacillus sp. CECT 9249]CAH0119948.1 hypothetical protein PAE9249_02457 [Paenibacillus sp. CECT 9249]
MRGGYYERGEGRHRTESGESQEHRGDRHGRHGSRHGMHGAQTFRRGRILAFLEQLQARRTTLARQLGEPEFEAIKQVISGELKALDHVIEEYIRLFDLQEVDSSSGTIHETGRK